jgi:hypothetical protein
VNQCTASRGYEYVELRIDFPLRIHRVVPEWGNFSFSSAFTPMCMSIQICALAVLGGVSYITSQVPSSIDYVHLITNYAFQLSCNYPHYVA